MILGYRGEQACAPQRGLYFDTAMRLFATYRLVDLLDMHPEIACLSTPPLPSNSIRTTTWNTELVHLLKVRDNSFFLLHLANLGFSIGIQSKYGRRPYIRRVKLYWLQHPRMTWVILLEVFPQFP